MARLVGIMANRRDRMEAIAHQERLALTTELEREGGDVSGYGMGFYQGDEVLHKKRPRAEGAPIVWREVLHGMQTDCAVLHARSPTVGDFRSENTHPFRMRRWLFAHTGTLGRFDSLKSRLRGAIHDLLARNIRGQTDSELFFHVVLSFLHDAGKMDDIDVPGEDVAAALRSSVALIDRLSAEVGVEPPPFGLLLTNGRMMAAMARGKQLNLVRRTGLHDPPEGVEPSPLGDPRTLRYLLFASGPTQPDFETLAPLDVVVAGRDLGVEFHRG